MNNRKSGNDDEEQKKAKYERPDLFKKRGLTHEEKKQEIGKAYNTAYEFSTRLFEKFSGIVKSSVLFGSAYKRQLKEGSDIDVLVIVDDTTVQPTRRFIDWYNTEVVDMINDIDPRLHVNSVTLTTFWENVKDGEPIAMNVLRDGISLIDTGFFKPLKQLLKDGRIRPTQEAIHNCLVRVPGHMTRARSRVLGGVVDFYWVMVDSAHAALMSYGKVPPSPEHIPEMMKKAFVKEGIVKKKYLNYFEEVRETAKAIIHGELIKVAGFDYDRYREMAENFGDRMKELVKEKEKEKG